jgi:hypothetical protein
MSGYAPVFQSVFTGTLHGRWPDTGLWLCLIAMADKNGELDVTPQYIASTTGLQLQDVVECMARFCEPDPYSRTPDCEGRRLVLLEPPRPWGWRIVNRVKYREKARLMSKDATRTATGADAARKRDERAASPAVPRSPPESPSQSQRQSHSHSHSGTRTHAREGKRADDPEAVAEHKRQKREELGRLEIEYVRAGFRTALAYETPTSYRTQFEQWRRKAGMNGSEGTHA